MYRFLTQLLALIAIATPLTVLSQPTHYSAALSGGKILSMEYTHYETFTPTTGINGTLLWHKLIATEGEPYSSYFGLDLGYTHIYDGLVGDRLHLAGFAQGRIAWRFDWTVGFGLSWFTNPYRRSLNPENEYIGSYTNCLINLGAIYNQPIGTKGDELFFDAKFVHSSCGYLYKPNHGINSLQFDLGYRFAARKAGEPTAPTHTDVGNYHGPKSLHPFLLLAPAFVMSRYSDNHDYYFAYSAELGLIRHTSQFFSYGGGLDISYNFSHHTVEGHQDDLPAYLAGSIFAEGHLERISLRIGGSIYVKDYELNPLIFYERVGAYYTIDNYNRVGIGMKVHAGRIDFIEWTYLLEL